MQVRYEINVLILIRMLFSTTTVQTTVEITVKFVLFPANVK